MDSKEIVSSELGSVRMKVQKFKTLVQKTFYVHCGNGLYRMKFPMPYHVLEDLNELGASNCSLKALCLNSLACILKKRTGRQCSIGQCTGGDCKRRGRYWTAAKLRTSCIEKRTMAVYCRKAKLNLQDR